MKRHERICYKNLNRECDVCEGEGVEFYAALGEDLGVTEGEKPCSACIIAEQLGGKSYLCEYIHDPYLIKNGRVVIKNDTHA